MAKDLKTRVVSLLGAIPYIEYLEINPSVFSDDIEKHDCDKCPASRKNQGDTFDASVCLQCWTDAVMDYTTSVKDWSLQCGRCPECGEDLKEGNLCTNQSCDVYYLYENAQ